MALHPCTKSEEEPNTSALTGITLLRPRVARPIARELASTGHRGLPQEK
jgi:hypothetical protein